VEFWSLVLSRPNMRTFAMANFTKRTGSLASGQKDVHTNHSMHPPRRVTIMNPVQCSTVTLQRYNSKINHAYLYMHLIRGFPYPFPQFPQINHPHQSTPSPPAYTSSLRRLVVNLGGRWQIDLLVLAWLS
jgi:hypothetical protein